MHVLVIDDDSEFRHFVGLALASGSFASTVAESPEEGLRLLAESPQQFDIVLLDVRMPRKSGWEVLLELREAGNEIPVVFVSAGDEVADRVRGLRMGADDYLVKPFEPEELVARLEAILRRRQALPTVAHADLKLDLALRRVERAGRPVELSPREYDVLLKLVDARGEVVGREELLRDLWGIDFDPETNLVEVQIGRVRRKLGEPDPIATVRGSGYRLRSSS